MLDKKYYNSKGYQMNDEYIRALNAQAIPALQKLRSVLIMLLPEEKRPEHLKNKDHDFFRDLFRGTGMPWP